LWLNPTGLGQKWQRVLPVLHWTLKPHDAYNNCPNVPFITWCSSTAPVGSRNPIAAAAAPVSARASRLERKCQAADTAKTAETPQTIGLRMNRCRQQPLCCRNLPRRLLQPIRRQEQRCRLRRQCKNLILREPSSSPRGAVLTDRKSRNLSLDACRLLISAIRQAAPDRSPVTCTCNSRIHTPSAPRQYSSSSRSPPAVRSSFSFAPRS